MLDPLSCQALARATLMRPLPWVQPVLALTGPQGSGKSTLLQAWCHAVGAHALNAAVLAPTTWCAAGLALDQLERGVDPHLLWALINRVQAAGIPLVLAGEGDPISWAGGQPDLASRLRAALRVEIGQPSDDDFHRLMLALARRRFLRLDMEAILWALDRVERSHAAVASLVAAIDRAARLEPAARPLRWVQRALATPEPTNEAFDFDA